MKKKEDENGLVHLVERSHNTTRSQSHYMVGQNSSNVSEVSLIVWAKGASGCQ